LSNAKLFVLERQIHAIAKQGDTDRAMERAERLIKVFEGGWYFLQIKAWVQREAGKLDDAIKTYKEVIDLLEQNDELEKETRERFIRNTKYVLSGVYLDNDQLDKSTEILQQLIKADPENPTFYNDLGFLWADHDMKLDESEKLIRKAIELDLAAKKKLAEEGKIDPEQAKRTNPAYADSLGWVLYKKGKYEEALPYLEEAAYGDDEESRHIEIWDHLGDTLLALGRKQEALETFQKALKMDDMTKKDVERRKKVTEKINKLKAELK
jgi:tetratricopeptide (TPR) repeat protein